MLGAVFMNKLIAIITILINVIILSSCGSNKQIESINDSGISNKCGSMAIDTFYLKAYTDGESKSIEIAEKKAVLDIERIFIHQLYNKHKLFFESYTDRVLIVSNESLKQLTQQLLYTEDINIVCKDTVVNNGTYLLHIAATIEKQQIIDRFVNLNTSSQQLPEGISKENITTIIEYIKN